MNRLKNMTEHIKTIIIGGGPAGSSCGYLLRKAGEDCLIIDKSDFPREKLCGGGLTPKTHIIFERIFDNLKYDYYNVGEMTVYAHQKKYSTFNLNRGIRTVLRSEFDNLLIDEYKKLGGRLLIGRLTLIEEKEGKIFITLNSGTQLSCDILIGADGATSLVRRYLQPGYYKGIICLEKKLPRRLRDNIDVMFDKRFDNGYMYIFPNKVGCVVGYGHKKSDIREFRTLMEEYQIPDDEKKTKGAYIPMLGKIDYLFRENILLIGDAGGYADSMTGEGLYYAFKTGENAAKAIIHKRNFKEESRSVLKEVRIIRYLSMLFYSKPFINMFLWMSTKPSLQRRINSVVNRYLAWEAK